MLDPPDEKVGDSRDITHDGKVKKEILEVSYTPAIIQRGLILIPYFRLVRGSKDPEITTFAMSPTKHTSLITQR